ncbi:hypothetical protein ACIQWA_36755 [Kitasatospora sp. NPDC098652]|uniref:hypothetical protein n=1 Tax=Kitasatospora sp. NPDC098652 TaxID=3364095 RepID=UPI00382ADBE4
MGRKKPGKPRRERAAAEYTLQQLQPPGYDQWMTLAPDAATKAATDPRLSPETIDLTRRLVRLGPAYGPKIPAQALWLDLALDQGALRLRRPDGTVGRLPVAELAAMLGGQGDGQDLRATVHELHAAGMLLVEPDGEDDCVLRVVIGKPARPGDPWLFGGDLASDLVPQTCIPGDPQTLGVEEFAALGYLRSHLAEGTTGTAEEYATFDGVGSVERAQELFDAVADLVDVRGCPACPSAHLCTRDPEAQPAL